MERIINIITISRFTAPSPAEKQHGKKRTDVNQWWKKRNKMNQLNLILLKSEFHELNKNSFLQVTNEKRKTVLNGAAEITKSLDSTFETLKEILNDLYENEYYITNDNFLVPIFSIFVSAPLI